MALTELQRTICRLTAANRIAQGESYVAGGVALNLLAAAKRISRDIDLFHDTRAAVQASWSMDRRTLEENGLGVEVLLDRPAFVEARIFDSSSSVLVQWTQDSAYRFFPLIRHEELGLTLHPFDLATNKVLALAGRLEPRDWIDVIMCHERIQPLGYLAWAACGKDPGFSPTSLLDHAGRSARYSNDEVAGLSFDGQPPDAAALSQQWRSIREEAREIVDLLPAENAGTCVMTLEGNLFCGHPHDVNTALESGAIRFHSGRIKGALPSFLS